MQRLNEKDHGAAIYELMKKAGITGLPPTYAGVQEYLIKNTLIGTVLDGVLQSAYILVPDTHGMSYLQCVGLNDLEPDEIRVAVSDFFDAQPELQAVWTQEYARKLSPLLRAGFMPATPLNILQPVLCLTRFSMTKRG